MDLDIKRELQERFNLIQKNKSDFDASISYEADYLKYVGESDYLATTIKNLVAENKIPASLMQDMYNYVMMDRFSESITYHSGLTYPKRLAHLQSVQPAKELPKEPPFWDRVIDEKFNLHSNFQKYRNRIYSSIWDKNADTVLSTETEYENKDGYEKDLTEEECMEEDFETIKNLHQNLMEKIEADDFIPAKKEKGKIGLPYTDTKKDNGYFIFNKRTKWMLIGDKDGRRFRLLNALCVPNFGAEVTRDTIWSHIKQHKDDLVSDLMDSHKRPQKITSIIDGTIKELEKKKYGLQGKIKFRHNEHKTRYWLTLIED